MNPPQRVQAKLEEMTAVATTPHADQLCSASVLQAAAELTAEKAVEAAAEIAGWAVTVAVVVHEVMAAAVDHCSTTDTLEDHEATIDRPRRL